MLSPSEQKKLDLAEFAAREKAKRQETEALREKAENSLREFVVQAWHVIEPATPFVPGWNIDAVADHLQGVSEGHIRNLLVNVPPRTSKSSLISIFWPAWDWIKHPELRWLYTSYTSKLTLEHSMKCRRVIESPWYQSNWKDRFHLIGEQNTKENYENDKTGHRIATSISGVGTGKGGDRLIGDDPNNVEEVESEVIRQNVIDNWDHSMSTRGNNPKTVAKVVVQQRTHEQDLSGHLIEQGGYVHLMLPMRFEVDRRCVTTFGGNVWQDPRRTEGQLLWPDRFGDTEVTEIEKRLGSYMAAGQLQQRPAPAGGGMLKTHWWKYWKPGKLTMDPVSVKMPDGTIQQIEAMELPEKFDTTIQAWDCSFKDEKTSDFVVGGVVAAKGANRFIIDLVRERMDLPKTVAAVRQLSARHPSAQTKLVEDKANGPAVIQMLHGKIGGFIAVNPVGGKLSRAAAASPMLESGNWYLPHPQLAPWVEHFIAECGSFPKGQFDDCVDFWSMSAARLLNNAAIEEDDESTRLRIRNHKQAGWTA